ncbi:MAG: hypothetical protein EOO11_15835 [Chitinophagaceae bacterium]|nr:MAG: hypothetical protein EOO11_15835 [Chitinophagaceae bacterium]
MKKIFLVAMATLFMTAAFAQRKQKPAPKKDTAAAAPVQDTTAVQPFYLVGDLQAFDRLYRAVKASAAPYVEVEPLITWLESQLKAQVTAREKQAAGAPTK